MLYEFNIMPNGKSFALLSGNLDRVEERKTTDADIREFDLWTSPDCAGTEFENCNRTWFYFSVSTPANHSIKILR